MTEIDVAKPGPIMAGKRGLVMGVANDRSIGQAADRTHPKLDIALGALRVGSAVGQNDVGKFEIEYTLYQAALHRMAGFQQLEAVPIEVGR